MQIKDIYDKDFDPAVFKGKPFMINVWASWCGPCVSELPTLSNLSQEYRDKMTLVGLVGEAIRMNQDGTTTVNTDEIEGAKALYEAKKIAYPSLVPNDLMLALMYHTQLRSIPTTWFFDGKAQLIHKVEGARDEDGWRKEIDAVLAYINEQAAKEEPVAP